MPSSRVMFVVQGEGRGHMTQALASGALLRDAGHRVTTVMVGRSPRRPVPTYFLDGMAALGAEVHGFDAPTQVSDSARRGLSPTGTAFDVVRRSPAFVRSVRAIARRSAEADVVVNFLDLLGGLSRFVSSRTPSLAVAHNYLFLHPELAGAPGPDVVRRLVLAYARLTAFRASRTLALAFEPVEPSASREVSPVEVVPPLLRPGLADVPVRDEGFLLAYALNPGYAARLAEWQRTHPHVTVHCYVEGGVAQDAGPGFHAHALDDRSFLDHLGRCRAYVGSAGFESICEAHHMGKPVLAVPTEGHFEQSLNAWDAERCGTARAGSYDDLDAFWADPPRPRERAVESFRRWVARAPETFVRAVEATVGSGAGVGVGR